jgi:hypothetical protein
MLQIETQINLKKKSYFRKYLYWWNNMATN